MACAGPGDGEDEPPEGAFDADVTAFVTDRLNVAAGWYDYELEGHVLTPNPETYVVRDTSTGEARYVASMAKAALAAGADGLLIEVHAAPERALCDGAQALTPEAFSKLSAELQQLAPLVGKRWQYGNRTAAGVAIERRPEPESREHAGRQANRRAGVAAIEDLPRTMQPGGRHHHGGLRPS